MKPYKNILRLIKPMFAEYCFNQTRGFAYVPVWFNTYKIVQQTALILHTVLTPRHHVPFFMLIEHNQFN